ncbi:hypothetical protein Sjap_021924 [Stephania japonica]|uniref:Uncharacterized protein n=1 Tax=Stephania japonica TaxID=461633 RepID=A0AAP0ER09_9MAGN
MRGANWGTKEEYLFIRERALVCPMSSSSSPYIARRRSRANVLPVSLQKFDRHSSSLSRRP